MQGHGKCFEDGRKTSELEVGELFERNGWRTNNTNIIKCFNHGTTKRTKHEHLVINMATCGYETIPLLRLEY